MTQTQISKTQALKEFLGSSRPVDVKELNALRKADPVGYDQLAIEAAKALGKEITA